MMVYLQSPLNWVVDNPLYNLKQPKTTMNPRTPRIKWTFLLWARLDLPFSGWLKKIIGKPGLVGGLQSKVLLQRTKKNNQSTARARWFFDPPFFEGKKDLFFFWKGSKVSPVSTNDIEMRSRLIWKGLFLNGRYCYQGGKMSRCQTALNGIGEIRVKVP